MPDHMMLKLYRYKETFRKAESFLSELREFCRQLILCLKYMTIEVRGVWMHRVHRIEAFRCPP